MLAPLSSRISKVDLYQFNLFIFIFYFLYFYWLYFIYLYYYFLFLLYFIFYVFFLFFWFFIRRIGVLLIFHTVLKWYLNSHCCCICCGGNTLPCGPLNQWLMECITSGCPKSCSGGNIFHKCAIAIELGNINKNKN